jgi:integrase
MGSELFEVGLYNPNAGAGESVMIPRIWDAGTIVKSVPWLRLQNREGRNIYIRPKGEHDLNLVDDLTKEAVSAMKQAGIGPAEELRRTLSTGSAYLYVREVVLFANWASHDGVSVAQGWRLYGEPREVRNLVHEYLTRVGECRVMRRPDTLGIRVAYVNAVDGTKINVRVLLAALKRLYEILSNSDLYAFPNPLVHAEAKCAIAEFRAGSRAAMIAFAGRPAMPPCSGIDPPDGIRLSENYFRLVRREWQPQSIDDPEFPRRVYATGERFGWTLREVCVARTLLESGARISEVFDLTAADWSVSGFGNQFSARSKGSFGQRVKTLVISNPTAKLFRRYFDQSRRFPAAEPLTVSALGRIQKRDPEHLLRIRIFLTQRGSPMTAGLFRDYYWRPARRAAGIEADPHTCRHWFVTNAMRHMEQAAMGDADLARHKQELIQYMAWRSGERTLKAYEHLERGRSFALRLQAIHREMGQREDRAAKELASGTENAAASPAGGRDLAFLLGEDDDD